MTTKTTSPDATPAAWQAPPGSYRITSTFGFSAAHHLNGDLPDGHKCRRQHGHTWTVQVTISSTALSGPGWVADFATLAPLRDYINQALDHRDLNEVLPVQPTSENLAAYLADWCLNNLDQPLRAGLESVAVAEGEHNRAEFRPHRNQR